MCESVPYSASGIVPCDHPPALVFPPCRQLSQAAPTTKYIFTLAPLLVPAIPCLSPASSLLPPLPQPLDCSWMAHYNLPPRRLYHPNPPSTSPPSPPTFMLATPPPSPPPLLRPLDHMRAAPHKLPPLVVLPLSPPPLPDSTPTEHSSFLQGPRFEHHQATIKQRATRYVHAPPSKLRQRPYRVIPRTARIASQNPTAPRQNHGSHSPPNPVPRAFPLFKAKAKPKNKEPKWKWKRSRCRSLIKCRPLQKRK